MRTLKSLVLASASVLALSVPVLAADAIVEQPPVPEATPVETFPTARWAGGYVGAYAGYGWGENDTNIPGKIETDGFKGGAYGGWNFQNNNFVYGLEGDLGYSGMEDSNFGYKAEQGVEGSARARVGYAFDPVMAFVTGGVAATEGKISANGGSDSNTHVGWTAGAGVEGFITDNIIGRVEYRYSDFGKKDYTVAGQSFENDLTTQDVRFGIGLKF